MQIFLQRQQYLVGIDRLDQIVGDAIAYRLVHDILLLRLGDHDDGHIGMRLVDAGQGLQAGQAGHILVEQHESVLSGVERLEGIDAVGDGVDVISLGLEE